MIFTSQQSEWERAQTLVGIPLRPLNATFIHCSDLYQVESVANHFYREPRFNYAGDRPPRPVFLWFENLEQSYDFPHLYSDPCL